MASFKRKGKKPKKKKKLESADGVVGTLFVTLVRAQLDDTDGEVPDPYAWAELKQEGEKSENTYKTRTIEDTQNPLWEEKAEFDVLQGTGTPPTG